MDTSLVYRDPSTENPIRPNMTADELTAAMPKDPNKPFLSEEEALERFRKGLSKGYKD